LGRAGLFTLEQLLSEKIGRQDHYAAALGGFSRLAFVRVGEGAVARSRAGISLGPARPLPCYGTAARLPGRADCTKLLRGDTMRARPRFGKRCARCATRLSLRLSTLLRD
jgi:hypothetical protein